MKRLPIQFRYRVTEFIGVYIRATVKMQVNVPAFGGEFTGFQTSVEDNIRWRPTKGKRATRFVFNSVILSCWKHSLVFLLVYVRQLVHN